MIWKEALLVGSFATLFCECLDGFLSLVPYGPFLSKDLVLKNFQKIQNSNPDFAKGLFCCQESFLHMINSFQESFLHKRDNSRFDLNLKKLAALFLNRMLLYFYLDFLQKQVFAVAQQFVFPDFLNLALVDLHFGFGCSDQSDD